jgi:hypothetical protein
MDERIAAVAFLRNVRELDAEVFELCRVALQHHMHVQQILFSFRVILPLA